MTRIFARFSGLTLILSCHLAFAQQEETTQPQDKQQQEPASSPKIDVGAQPTNTSQQEPSPNLQEQLLRSIVKVSQGRSWSYGFVYPDSRTVVLEEISVDLKQRVMVTTYGGNQARRTVTLMEKARNRNGKDVLILHLDSDLEVKPLEASSNQPAIGQRAFSMLFQGHDYPQFELIESRIQGVSPSGFFVSSLGDSGMPVTDENGRVMGVYSRQGYSLRSDGLMTGLVPVKAKSVVQPAVALRFGILQDAGGSDRGMFSIYLDAGIHLWEVFSVVLKLGISFDFNTTLISLTDADLGSGIAAGRAMDGQVGLELKYALWLNRSSRFLLHFAVGVNFIERQYLEAGMAAFSGPGGCVPSSSVCPVTFRNPDRYLDNAKKIGIGPSIGFDLDRDYFSVGYRFTPEALSYHLSNTHMVLMGIAF